MLDQLRVLEGRGVYLLICSTCLHSIDLQVQVVVGLVGGMLDIIEAQWKAGKVFASEIVISGREPPGHLDGGSRLFP